MISNQMSTLSLAVLLLALCALARESQVFRKLADKVSHRRLPQTLPNGSPSRGAQTFANFTVSCAKGDEQLIKPEILGRYVLTDAPPLSKCSGCNGSGKVKKSEKLEFPDKDECRTCDGAGTAYVYTNVEHGECGQCPRELTRTENVPAGVIGKPPP